MRWGWRLGEQKVDGGTPGLGLVIDLSSCGQRRLELQEKLPRKGCFRCQETGQRGAGDDWLALRDH